MEAFLEASNPFQFLRQNNSLFSAENNENLHKKHIQEKKKKLETQNRNNTRRIFFLTHNIMAWHESKKVRYNIMPTKFFLN
jgi:hypothetical protein